MSEKLHIIIQSISINVIVQVKQDSDDVMSPKESVAVCPYCGWTKGYPDDKSAKNGLSKHIGRWCKGNPPTNVMTHHLRKIMSNE